jgi:4-hydroxy-2-oxoheptanedioate aldolase
LQAGEPLLGTFLQLGDPMATEVAGRAGFDLCIIDLEHGGLGAESIGPLVRAADCVGLPLLVRVGLEGLHAVGPALDLGVRGVLAAQVSNAGEARRVVDTARFPPDGVRGACPGIRASQHGWVPFPEYMEWAREETIVAVALEGPEAIDELDAIMTVPGLDMVFVGVFDLSKSLGITGQLDDPAVEDAVTAIAATAQSHGLAMGTWAPDMAVGSRWLAAGARFLALGTDVLLWGQACRKVVGDWYASEVVTALRASGGAR